MSNELGGKIKAIEGRMDEIAVLQKHIGNYGKTRDVYAAYRQDGYSKRFLAEHEREIALHKEAKKAFDSLDLERIPSIKGLRQEYFALLAQKKTLYEEYNAVRKDMKDFLTAKSNVDRLLGYRDTEQAKETRSPQL